MKVAWSAWIVVGLVFCASCGPSMSVRRTSADTATDVSGRWNDTDARLVAAEMISSCLSGGWLTRFAADSGGEQPVVIMGMVVNQTDEHIRPRVILKALEKALINSGKARVVTNSQFRGHVADEQKYQASGVVDPRSAARIGHQLGADFILFGNIESIRDRWEGKEVVFYQVTFELHSTTTSQVVWIGDKKIKKVKQQRSMSW
jgi:uncharacterized protein (TIGR02722 family)